MRILITTTAYCEYAISQANGLAAIGHSVLLMMPGKLIDATVGKELNLLLEKGVSCLRYELTGRKKITFYRNIWTAIAGFHPDIIHLHENGELETLSILFRFFKIPFITSVHDVAYHPGVDSQLYLRRKIIIKLLRLFSDKILVHGDFVQKQLKKMKMAWFHKSVIIPHGNLDLFLHWRKTIVHKESRTCLFFGRMEKYKGLDHLLKIGKILKDRIPEIRIIVAGTGSELTKYKDAMITSGIYEIHEHFIPDSDVYKYFDRSSLLLLPYHEASQSGIAIMGLTFGLPVVAMAAGSIPDLISDWTQGRLVEIGDTASFAEAVCNLIEDTATQERQRSECLKLAADLDFKRLALRFEEVYRELVYNC